MSGLALALVLCAALMHAVWNISAKKTGGGAHFVLMSAVFVVLLWGPLALWMAVDEVPRWGGVQWLAVLASAVLHMVYYRALLRGYRQADLTVVYPVARGTGPLWSTLGAVWLLGESLSRVGAAGVAAVCVGVMLIAGAPAMLRRAWARGTGGAGGAVEHDAALSAARARLHSGLRWGLFIGTLSAAYTVLDGWAVRTLAVAPIVLDYVGNALRIPLIAPATWRERAQARHAWRTQWRPALLGAVLGPMAYVMVLYAMTLAPLSRVAPAREVSMLFAALIGGHLLGEADRGARLAGAVCLAAGVMALAWG